MSTGWHTGNRFELLENGNAFFPAVQDAIAKASQEVLIETFILCDDEVGRALQQSLIQAARRGATVVLTLDGYGSDPLDPSFLDELVTAGVQVHVFDPRPRLFGMRFHLFRRLHRKLIAIDGAFAFVGGINFAEDHLTEYGAQAKQDYAVSVRGPLCEDIAAYMRAAIRAIPGVLPSSDHAPFPDEDGAGKLVVRDNGRHRQDIERLYRTSLRAAREEVLIANAYFFPGYRLLHDIAMAARRGVRVRVILQGEPDLRIAQLAAMMLYDYLIEAGVEIYEYCRRPLHGKVACFDQDWATVGSSNLDPFSLALNLEANVLIRDRALNQALRQRLERMLREDCVQASRSNPATRRLRRMWAGVVVFHVLRRFPAWVGSLPAHKPACGAWLPNQTTTISRCADKDRRMSTFRARTTGHHGLRKPAPRAHSWQKWLAIGTLVIVAGLLYYLARDVDWPAVWKAVRAVPRTTIALAIVATVAGYLAYASMDLLGRRYTKHKLSPVNVAGVAMMSYAVNLNLGMLLGGFGARLRLYVRMGCRKSLPTRVALFSALSNWVGFGWAAGGLFASNVVPLPPNMAWGQGGLRIAGCVLLALSLCYVLACLKYPGYTWSVRRWRIVLPGIAMAVAQSVTAALSWGLMGLVLYILLQARVPYLAVLGVLLYASVAALVVRVPGGLGTTEAITVAALSQYLSPVDVLSAVLTYRAVYFLLPLTLSLLIFGILEGRWSIRRHASPR